MSSRRVMIVDDNSDAAELLAAMLQMLGHTTVVANCGADALRMATDFHPELAFLDIGMPGMNGFDLACALHQLEGFAQLPLVAVTGWDDITTVHRTQQVGFARHITKPAGFDEIEESIRLFA